MQKSFCVSAVLTVLIAATAAQVKGECPVLEPFRQAGEHHFTVHGAFFNLVFKKFLHEWTEENLPNALILTLGSEEFSVQDIYEMLSDALAEMADHFVMGKTVDYNTSLRHACVGNVAHKFFAALLKFVGISSMVSDEVKDEYRQYGKGWFSKAFAIGIDNMVSSFATSGQTAEIGASS